MNATASRTSYCFYGSCKDLENRPDAAIFHHTEYWHGIRVHIYRCRYCGRTHREAAEPSARSPIAGRSDNPSLTRLTRLSKSTAQQKKTPSLIAYAREHGACVYEWPRQSNTRSLYALPDGTGMYIESQWGGGWREPWTLSYACPISAGDLEQEIARYNEGMEYEGKIRFINPFTPNTDQPIASGTEDAPSAPHVHYHYGSGIHGCLYDYGPEISTSIEEAVDDFAAIFELDDSQRRELTERRFIALGGEYGADYAEITPCNEPECLDYLYYVRQFAGQPISKKGA